MNYSTRRYLYTSVLFFALMVQAAGAAAQQGELAVECDEGVIAEPIAIAFGNSTQNCVVDNVTDRDRFTVTGSSGTTVRVLLLSGTNFFDPRLEIRDTLGTVIVDQFCSGQNQFGNGIRCSFEANLVLPEDGNFDLAISDSGSNETGSYTMQVESIPPAFALDLVPFDQSVSDATSPGTDMDFFGFFGSPGTEVRVNLLSRTNFYDPRLEIRAPDGSSVADVACSGQNQFGNGIRCSTAVVFSPAVSGTYLIAISDSGSNEAGDYEFSVFCLSGPCDSDGVGDPDPDPTVIAYDSPIGESINSGTDGGFFQFFVNGGSTVQLNVFSSTNFFDPAVQIRDSSGALVESQSCSGQNQFGNGIRCSFSILFEIADSDLYRIAFFDSATDEAGGATISLFCLHGPCDSDGTGGPDPDPAGATYVSTNTAPIESATDGGFYQLYGIVDAEIRIDVVSTVNFFDPVAQVRDPSGNLLAAGSCSGQNQFGNGIRCSFSLNAILPATGYYDIALFDSGTNEAGGFRYTAHCMRGVCDSDADGLVDPVPKGVAYGSAEMAPISPATDLDLYTIHGTAGDDIQLSVASMTNFFDPRLEVFAPDGMLLNEMACSGQNQFGNGIMCSFSMSLTSLPATGVYRVALSDAGTDEAGSYEFGLQCVFGTCANPPPPSPVGDNCIEFANSMLLPDAGGNAQLDTDGDGIGNHCDADLNDDCIVNVTDLGILRTVFFSMDSDADFNGDGLVNAIDLGIMKRVFFSDFTVDSPSGIPDFCD